MPRSLGRARPFRSIAREALFQSHRSEYCPSCAGPGEQHRTSNSMWRLVTGPIDTLIRYAAECAIWVNCPTLGDWQEFWGSMTIVPMSEGPRMQWFQGRLNRLLKPEQRLSVHLDRIAPTFPHGNLVSASVDAALGFAGGVSWGGLEFHRTPSNEFREMVRESYDNALHIGECELHAAAIAPIYCEREGQRNIAPRTENQNVLSSAPQARHAPNRSLRHLNLFCLTYGADILPVYKERAQLDC